MNRPKVSRDIAWGPDIIAFHPPMNVTSGQAVLVRAIKSMSSGHLEKEQQQLITSGRKRILNTLNSEHSLRILLAPSEKCWWGLIFSCCSKISFPNSGFYYYSVSCVGAFSMFVVRYCSMV